MYNDTIIIGVTVQGIPVGQLQVSLDEPRESVIDKASSLQSVVDALKGRELVKTIYKPGRIVAFTVKPYYYEPL